MKITMILFDAFTSLDAIGGYEVLARLPGVDFEFAAMDTGVIAADTRRLGITAYRSLRDIDHTDLLYVPGGPGVEALKDNDEFLNQLRRLDAQSKWTVGICNGVLLLAAAGLLKDKQATTNYFCREQLAKMGAVVQQTRSHRDGKYITGAGVSASIDTALMLAKDIGGESLMKVLALGIEYFPEPPYSEKLPEDMPEFAHEALRQYGDSVAATQLRLKPPFSAVGH